MNLEQLARCTAQAASLNPTRGSQSELTRAEIIAALSGLSCFATWWAQWKLLDDTGQSKRKLERAAIQLAKVRMIESGKYAENDEEKYAAMAVLAMNHAVNPRICFACNQAPERMSTCGTCNGVGVMRPYGLRKKIGGSATDWRNKHYRQWKIIDSAVSMWVGTLAAEVIARVSRE